MSQVQLIHRQDATGTTRELLDQIHGAFGSVPGMFAAAANSQATLSALWCFSRPRFSHGLPPART